MGQTHFIHSEQGYRVSIALRSTLLKLFSTLGILSEYVWQFPIGAGDLCAIHSDEHQVCNSVTHRHQQGRRTCHLVPGFPGEQPFQKHGESLLNALVIVSSLLQIKYPFMQSRVRLIIPR